MIKIGITYRLFLAILSATCLAILCMFLIMQWSINRGFIQYLNVTAHETVESITINLERVYAENGSWEFFRKDPSFWVTRVLNKRPETEKPGENGKIKPPRMPPLVILDAERKPLFGNPDGSVEINYKTVVNGDITVGYVGFLPPKQFLSPHQLQFLRQQKLALITAVLAVGLVGLLFSLPLARRMVRPVKTLARAIDRLSSGKYDVRVPVSSSDELGSLARAFNSMAMTLEKNETARRQWVADISHELRTPLAVLRGETEALLEGVRTITPDAIRSLHTEIIRLHRLVDDLHQLTLSDLGALTYHKENLDLADVIEDSVQTHHAKFVRKRIRLLTDIPKARRTPVFGDWERLQQLFSNLFDNSLKYTNPDGELVIRLRHDDARATIDFEDSSPGVPAEDMEKLFDRLFRVDASRNRASGGSGLGLAICRNIVEAHEGTIFARPSSLGGVLIRINIPLSEATA